MSDLYKKEQQAIKFLQAAQNHVGGGRDRTGLFGR